MVWLDYDLKAELAPFRLVFSAENQKKTAIFARIPDPLLRERFFSEKQAETMLKPVFFQIFLLKII